MIQKDKMRNSPCGSILLYLNEPPQREPFYMQVQLSENQYLNDKERQDAKFQRRTIKKLCYKQLETANTDRWQQAIRKIEKNGIN